MSWWSDIVNGAVDGLLQLAAILFVVGAVCGALVAWLVMR